MLLLTSLRYSSLLDTTAMIPALSLLSQEDAYSGAKLESLLQATNAIQS